MKKLSAFICAIMVMTMLSTSVVLANVPTDIEGGFTQVTDVGGIQGSCFYIYIPADLEIPYPIMTPVIYVYGNEPYDDKDTAWAALTATGLDIIADEEKAVIIMVNPVGDTWGRIDIDVYEAIMLYIYYVDGPVPITFHSMQYAIGEGSGATFIGNRVNKCRLPICLA